MMNILALGRIAQSGGRTSLITLISHSVYYQVDWKVDFALVPWNGLKIFTSQKTKIHAKEAIHWFGAIAAVNTEM